MLVLDARRALPAPAANHAIATTTATCAAPCSMKPSARSSDEGVEALTLRTIGLRLGVSRTALYRHFADKRALLSAVATEGFRLLRERLVEAWGSGGVARIQRDGRGLHPIRDGAPRPTIA